MSLTDPIADMLTMIRNAMRAKKRWVVVPSSNSRRAIVEVLKRERYVRDYDFIDKKPQPAMKVHLNYDRTDTSVMSGIKRMSKPGRRMYVRSDKIPRVRGGLGTAVLSTSSGILTDKEARARGIGGEWICNVW
jgi:small subunit ribosomal protein S8